MNYSDAHIARKISQDWTTVGFMVPANTTTPSHSSARETHEVKDRMQLAPSSSNSMEYSRKVSDLSIPDLSAKRSYES